MTGEGLVVRDSIGQIANRLQYCSAKLKAAERRTHGQSSPRCVDMPRDGAMNPIPVTLVTGFLGAGKTTLLNHVLGAGSGLRFAVIENEFGDVGIDDALLAANTKIQQEEEIFEMMNGDAQKTPYLCLTCRPMRPQPLT